ncbi:MAG: histidine kinase [Blautia sp.]|nr:histidine kinase [Blautia sp.]MCM1199837.1 histidine kinase [Bacteroides fragilis]
MNNITSDSENNFSILDIREMERKRIAKDLHDVTLQNLSHLIHKIELGSIYIDQDPVKAKLEFATVEKELRQIINDVRIVIYNMYPVSLEDIGLKNTIEKMSSTVCKKYNFSLESDVDDVSCENKLIQVSILRFIQESYYNAIKHSKGNKLFISLKEHEKTIFLKIKDNGIGFKEEEVNKQDFHFGLSMMKETVSLLNGKININSSENGTAIEIEIPF